MKDSLSFAKGSPQFEAAFFYASSCEVVIHVGGIKGYKSVIVDKNDSLFNEIIEFSNNRRKIHIKATRNGSLILLLVTREYKKYPNLADVFSLKIRTESIKVINERSTEKEVSTDSSVVAKAAKNPSKPKASN